MSAAWFRDPAPPPIRLYSSEFAEDIRAAVAGEGEWINDVEWRISTVTTTTIRKTGEAGHRAYSIRVECDYVLLADCPTIDRAIELADAYERTIQRLFHDIGWAGWASKTTPNP